MRTTALPNLRGYAKTRASVLSDGLEKHLDIGQKAPAKCAESTYIRKNGDCEAYRADCNPRVNSLQCRRKVLQICEG